MSNQLKTKKSNITVRPHPRIPACRRSGMLPASVSAIHDCSRLPTSALPAIGLPRRHRRPCPRLPDVARRSPCSQQGEAGARVRGRGGGGEPVRAPECRGPGRAPECGEGGGHRELAPKIARIEEERVCRPCSGTRRNRCDSRRGAPCLYRAPKVIGVALDGYSDRSCSPEFLAIGGTRGWRR
jgi:hypothetical protein